MGIGATALACARLSALKGTSAASRTMRELLALLTLLTPSHEGKLRMLCRAPHALSLKMRCDWPVTANNGGAILDSLLLLSEAECAWIG